MMVSLSTKTSLLVPGALTHRLQNLTACLIQNGLWGLEIGQILLNKFFDSIIPATGCLKKNEPPSWIDILATKY